MNPGKFGLPARAVLFLAILAAAGCIVEPVGQKGGKCTKTHLCEPGYSCMDNKCVPDSYLNATEGPGFENSECNPDGSCAASDLICCPSSGKCVQPFTCKYEPGDGEGGDAEAEESAADGELPTEGPDGDATETGSDGDATETGSDGDAADTEAEDIVLPQRCPAESCTAAAVECATAPDADLLCRCDDVDHVWRDVDCDALCNSQGRRSNGCALDAASSAPACMCTPAPALECATGADCSGQTCWCRLEDPSTTECVYSECTTSCTVQTYVFETVEYPCVRLNRLGYPGKAGVWEPGDAPACSTDGADCESNPNLGGGDGICVRIDGALKCLQNCIYASGQDGCADARKSCLPTSGVSAGKCSWDQTAMPVKPAIVCSGVCVGQDATECKSSGQIACRCDAGRWTQYDCAAECGGASISCGMDSTFGVNTCICEAGDLECSNDQSCGSDKCLCVHGRNTSRCYESVCGAACSFDTTECTGGAPCVDFSHYGYGEGVSICWDSEAPYCNAVGTHCETGGNSGICVFAQGQGAVCMALCPTNPTTCAAGEKCIMREDGAGVCADPALILP